MKELYKLSSSTREHKTEVFVAVSMVLLCVFAIVRYIKRI